jgi:sugar phosphate isomerase/epimerase
MNNVRLKTALNSQQIHNRMKFNPEIVEFHLKEENLYEPEEIVKYIQEFKSKGARVYLHHPMTYRGKYLDIISSSQEMRDFYDWSCDVLALICKQENIKCIIHCHYVKSESTNYVNPAERKETRQRIEEILNICDKSFLWEDTIRGIFSAENPFLLSEIIQPLNLPLNIDISHSFIALKGDNDKLQQHLESYHRFAKYFHLVDSNGVKHDSLSLGRGRIDWAMVKSYVKETDFIFEIDLKDSNYMDCSPMIESAKYFNNIKEKFRVN